MYYFCCLQATSVIQAIQTCKSDKGSYECIISESVKSFIFSPLLFISISFFSYHFFPSSALSLLWGRFHPWPGNLHAKGMSPRPPKTDVGLWTSAHEAWAFWRHLLEVRQDERFSLFRITHWPPRGFHVNCWFWDLAVLEDLLTYSSALFQWFYWIIRWIVLWGFWFYYSSHYLLSCK